MRLRERRVCERCYLRGTSWLGLLNTLLGCMINRVLVQKRDQETGQTIGWFWAKATAFPRGSGS